ncbi:MAG: ABC transporter substrate-binding protein [Acidimicrobiia bacterium]
MLPRRANRVLWLAVGLALVSAACSSSRPADLPVIEVFGPYRDADAVKFAATVAPFEDEAGVDVRFVGTGSFATEIQKRITEAEYPDVALFPQPALIVDMASRGLLAPLPDSLQAGSGDDTAVRSVGGFVGQYAVWFRAAAKSLVWYRPPEFASRGYVVPTTWDEMMALSETMVNDGLSPWCLAIESFSSTGWVGTDWIEDIVLREQGVTLYDEWVKGKVRFDSFEIREAFRTFGEIVHGNKTVLGGTNRILNESWQRAADPMFDDPPACMMHRQASFWASEIPAGFTFGEDIDYFVLPGLTDAPPPLLVSGDMAAAFNDRPEVVAFMEFLASPRAGEPWAELGGFISPNPEFDDSRYASAIDRQVAKTIEDASQVRFDASDTMPPAVGTDAFWLAMRTFIRTGNINAAVISIDEAWPRITLYENDG